MQRVTGALASMRLAVVMMVALSVICGWATVYESKHGTPAAQRDFYGTGWFSLLLVLLGLNILFSMFKRYPWKTQHAGFLAAHIGIVVLLGGSLVSLHYGLDSSMALYEGDTTDRVELPEKALQVALPGHGAQGTFPAAFEKNPPASGRERRLKVAGSDATLVVEEFAPHVVLSQSLEERPGGGPALRLSLASAMGSDQAWLVARDPERNHLSLGPASFALQVAATQAEADALAQPEGHENAIRFVFGPDRRTRYVLTTRSGGESGWVEVGKPIATPWMGLTITPDRLLESAAIGRKVTPAPPPAKDGRQQPAVKLHLETASQSSPSEWLVWGESREVPVTGGIALVAYRPPQLQVPFRVTLLKFQSEKYPGSNMAATYESSVRIEDPERGISEHPISMNRPLHYRGYIFFQSSFVEGTPMMSIFSVTRAPGLPLVYLGVALITGGVAWMFYLKPYLARRQGAAALAARRRPALRAALGAAPVRGQA